MVEEEEFKKLFQRIVETYQITPETAAELLQRILTILASDQEETDTA